MTKASFIIAVPSLAAMTATAAEKTYQGWVISGRIKQEINPISGAVTVDQKYVQREAARTFANTNKASGLFRPI